MRVELSNVLPDLANDGQPTPTVTYVGVPDSYDYQPHQSAEVLAGNLARHLATAGGVTRLGDHSDGTGDHEAFLSVVRSWSMNADGIPAWVWSDNNDFAVLLGAFYGCPVGRPDDIEMTHHTDSGPPGVGPAPEGTE